MFGNHGLCGLPEEGAHEKSPKCLGGNLGDFGEFCKGLNPPVGTTLRLRLKRIQLNPLALVGIGTTNRSAGSTREADVSTNTRFRLMDSKARGQSPRYGVRLSQACFDE